MIVRDEEQNLSDCLTPLAGLFQEIVVVDTGSRDRTREVARQFTPHIFDFPWCDDFSAARNESLRHTHGQWVMWLDADDRLRPPSVQKLRELLASLSDWPRTFMMDTLCLPAPGDEPCVVTHPRLFRQHPALHWEGRVHEQIWPDPIQLGHAPHISDVQIEHVGYVDRATSDRKLRRKLRLLRMEYAVDPDNCNTLLHLGLAQLGVGNISAARRHLLRLTGEGAAPVTYTRCVYAVLASVSLQEGKLAETMQLADRGLALFPGDEQFLYAKAQALYVSQEYAAAANVLMQIIHGPPQRKMQFGGVAAIRQKLAPHLLGAIQFTQRSYVQAEATIRALLAEFPHHTGSWFNLGLIHLATGEERKLVEDIAQLSACPDGRLDAMLLTARWRLQQRKLAAAGAIIDQIIGEAPNAPAPRALRVEWLVLSHAPLSVQIQAVREVLRVEPGHLEAQGWLKTLQRLVPAAPAAPPAIAGDWASSAAFAGGAGVG
jgi:tetratricopeptide (TPR) repeat protein